MARPDVPRQRLTLSWEWKLLGDAQLSPLGGVMMPKTRIRVPTIYRFILHDRVDRIYIGESANVRARFRGHRFTGRVSDTMRTHLQAEKRVSVWIADRIKFGNMTAYGLELKTNRLAIEGAAVLLANLNQEGEVLNID